ncbi:hypothetical protein RF11_02001 [Thelohanellus kitauei]|uniref:Uncharacterized protein n=1 Tax=Thelohanellus kitauei TaxID=669202 RepID=A0A0C2MV22_THEKT|nr:hypothetical protein RF11_02001 [Thelohanellus kitauei]
MHPTIFCLSHRSEMIFKGKSPKNVFDIHEEPKLFFNKKAKPQFEALSSEECNAQKIAYLIDIFAILNDLNLSHRRLSATCGNVSNYHVKERPKKPKKSKEVISLRLIMDNNYHKLDDLVVNLGIDVNSTIIWKWLNKMNYSWKTTRPIPERRNCEEVKDDSSHLGFRPENSRFLEGSIQILPLHHPHRQSMEQPDCVTERESEGFESVAITSTAADVEELIDEHRHELTTEELQQLQEEQKRTLTEEMYFDEDEGRKDASIASIKEMCANGRISKTLWTCIIQIKSQAVEVHFRKVVKRRDKQVTFYRFYTTMMEQHVAEYPQPKNIVRVELPEVIKEEDSPSEN